METKLFLLLYSLRGIHPFAPQVISFLGHYLPYILIAGLLLYLFFGNISVPKKRLFIVVASLVSSGTAYLLVEIIQGFYQTPRPFAALKHIAPLIDKSSMALSSFPSAHAAIFFALGTFLYFYHTRLGALYLIGAVLVSIARVMAGVHWPLDILAGAALGIASAHIIKWFTQGIKRNL